jgi:hypothetical protein
VRKAQRQYLYQRLQQVRLSDQALAELSPAPLRRGGGQSRGEQLQAQRYEVLHEAVLHAALDPVYRLFHSVRTYTFES